MNHHLISSIIKEENIKDDDAGDYTKYLVKQQQQDQNIQKKKRKKNCSSGKIFSIDLLRDIIRCLEPFLNKRGFIEFLHCNKEGYQIKRRCINYTFNVTNELGLNLNDFQILYDRVHSPDKQITLRFSYDLGMIQMQSIRDWLLPFLDRKSLFKLVLTPSISKDMALCMDLFRQLQSLQELEIISDDLTSLDRFPRVKRLYVLSKVLVDISYLSKLKPDLVSVEFRACWRLKDISFIKDIPNIKFSGCCWLYQLSTMRGDNQKSLCIEDQECRDPLIFEAFQKVVGTVIYDFGYRRFPTPLVTVPLKYQCEILKFRGINLLNLQSIEFSSSLKSVSIDRCQLNERMFLSFAGVSELTISWHPNINEERFVLDFTTFANLQYSCINGAECNVSSLQSLKKLKSFHYTPSSEAYARRITNSDLESFKSIRCLSLSGRRNSLSDITSLNGLLNSNIQVIHLQEIHVNDFTPLRNIRKVTVFFCKNFHASHLTNVEDLTILKSPVKDLHKLSHLKYLLLESCSIRTIPKLGKSIKKLKVRHCSALSDVSKLKESEGEDGECLLESIPIIIYGCFALNKYFHLHADELAEIQRKNKFFAFSQSCPKNWDP